MYIFRTALAAIFVLFVAACDHPIQISGEGDVTSATNTRNCSLEDFRAGNVNCAKNTVIGDYQERYSATPRDGWRFTGWEGCPSTNVNGSCSLSIPADTVVQFWGQAAPPLRAIFSQGAGVLVAEVRATGFSDTYRSNVAYKQVVDAFLVEMKGYIKEIESDIKWKSNIPVVFSGCAQKGAFFGAGIDAYAQILRDVPNPSLVFGPNVTGNVLVMCHEITEAALQLFLLDPTTAQNLKTIFGTNTDQELLAAAVVSAVIFELQVLFHELGHGLDFLLLKDAFDNSKKLQSFTIPIPNQCGAPNCDTIANDFADWISAAVLIGLLEEEINTNSEQAGIFAKAWLVALASWSDILGAGGGSVAHGVTEARQVNMLCYAYGALPALRSADANELKSGLAQAISAQGLDPASCQNIYNRNLDSTATLLGNYIN